MNPDILGQEKIPTGHALSKSPCAMQTRNRSRFPLCAQKCNEIADFCTSSVVVRHSPYKIKKISQELHKCTPSLSFLFCMAQKLRSFHNNVYDPSWNVDLFYNGLALKLVSNKLFSLGDNFVLRIFLADC